jgi:hypothetical protein
LQNSQPLNHKVEISWEQFFDGNLPETPERRMFRQAVTQAALQAMDAMPDANGRVERARDLVLTGAVTPQDDGTFIVKGLGCNGKDYTVSQHSCTCPDQAKGFTCKHRIALWIWRTARAAVHEQLLPPEPPAFLPEAPASCNVFVTLAGRKVHITLRDHDETRMLHRLEDLLHRFPLEPEQTPEAPTTPKPVKAEAPPVPEPVQELEPVQAEKPAPPAEPPAREDWCTIHSAKMRLRSNSQGSWWSHRLPNGDYCKGSLR